MLKVLNSTQEINKRKVMPVLYHEFQDLRLSSLGMGNMRLPTLNGGPAIDEATARPILEYAYQSGINYYDTAYSYHGGASERFVGKVMGQFPRDTWYLASKMPGHMMNWKNGKLGFQGYMVGSKATAPSDIFEEQLEKCGVDYFDFYLLHNLSEASIDFYMNEDVALVDYLLAQKKAGRIRHLGFSAHGRADTIEQFINWRDCFEFAQIQLNYMDWTLQEARRSYELLAQRGIPVVVMEPCRGGKLATLTGQASALLKNARPNDSLASWAFRFLQSLPGVKVVLSGMSTLEQLKENIALFAKHDPVTPAEAELLQQAVSTMVSLVPCTACGYCRDGCPQQLHIPKLISMYNEISYESSFSLGLVLRAMAESELPSACIACNACSPVCPQGIDIPSVMTRFATILAESHK